MKLNTLNIKIKKPKKRLGRGIGSTKGKTSGRGHKGQKSRSGVAIKSFEGGQMPLYRRLPKRGFHAIRKKNITILNLDQLQKYITQKTLSISNLISIAELKNKNILKNKKDKIKILGKGDLKDKVNIEVNFISKSAKEKIEKNGGLIKFITK